jgi:hypothetical protein
MIVANAGPNEAAADTSIVVASFPELHAESDTAAAANKRQRRRGTGVRVVVNI